MKDQYFPTSELTPLVRAAWNARSSVFPHSIDWTGDWMKEKIKPVPLHVDLIELSEKDEWWNDNDAKEEEFLDIDQRTNLYTETDIDEVCELYSSVSDRAPNPLS